MERLVLTPQMILGFSGECSSCSCEGKAAKKYMEKIKDFQIKREKEIQTPSADRLKELSIQIDSLKTQ